MLGQGTKSEQLMVRYFQLDPVLSQRYPGSDGKPDTGIDPVALEVDAGTLT